MIRLTFHGDPALKDRYLARLRDHVAAGRFRFAPVWENGRGSALGGTIGADDVAAYAAALGYPEALALVYDPLVTFRSADPGFAHATDFAIRWLAETPVGVDLSRVAGMVLCELLDLPLMRGQAAGYPAIDAARRTVIDLHRAALSEAPPSRDAWRDARRAAVHATDSAPDEAARHIAAVVEAASWPHTVRTTLSDTLGALSQMAGAAAMRDIGWTDEKEAAVFAMFDTISREATGEPPVGDAILAELARRDADLAAAFAGKCEAMTLAQMIYTHTGDTLLRHIAATGR